MNPWNIIGWMVLAFFAILALAFVYALLRIAYRQTGLFVLYFRTRKVVPKEGQVWIGKHGSYTIDDVLEDGRIILKSGNISWGEDLKDWKRRMYRGRLHLRKTS